MSTDAKGSAMHEILRGWIIDVLNRHQPLLAIALRQRAKFEGWLKFELAASAEQNGAASVCVEASSDDGGASRCRSDLSFYFDRVRYDVELKTPNGNWRLPGVDNLTRPITKNIAEIIADARKLSAFADQGLVAFVLFPLPPGDQRWHEYLQRISVALERQLSPAQNAVQVTLPLFGGSFADVVVCSFPVSRAPLSVPSNKAVQPTRACGPHG